MSKAPPNFESWKARAAKVVSGQIQTGDNFAALYNHKAENRDYFGIYLMEGGSRSGKTFDIIRFLYTWALSVSRRGVKGKFLVTRETMVDLKISAYRDFMDFLKDIGVYSVNNHDRTNHIYRLGQIDFYFLGADNPERFKGPAWIGAWVNEAIPYFSKDAFDQIDQRTTGFKIIDYNPKILDHWVYGIQNRPDTTFIHSTLINNPFAPLASAKRIFAYEPTAENIKYGTADKTKWEIYGLGKRGGFSGLVYKNWTKVSKKPEGVQLFGYGLDFGFANDPTAMVAVYKMPLDLTKKKPAIFVQTLFRETGMFNEDIYSAAVNSEGFNRGMVIICDHEVKAWTQLGNMGLYTSPAKKYAGSVVDQTAHLAEFDVYYLGGDQIEDEVLSYTYKPIKGNDTAYTNTPMKGNDHCMNALQYFVHKCIDIPRPM